MKTGLILLAAGNSTRMGTPKQLLQYRGRPLVHHAALVALQSRCRPVIVVLGANAGPVRQALHDLPVEPIENPLWSEGMGTSIQAGLRAAVDYELDGIILALADQPLVTADTYNLLVAGHETSAKPIVTSVYAGTVGVPVYFAREYFPHLMALKPDQGCKGVILAHSDNALRIACSEAEEDIDTPLDYLRLTPTS